MYDMVCKAALHRRDTMKKDYRKEAMDMSKSHWEKDVSDSVFPKARKNVPADAFLAKNPKDWPREHTKINETDY